MSCCHVMLSANHVRDLLRWHAMPLYACRLYESWGFQHTPWVDPAWQEDAEKGRMVRQRRVMMIKPLSGPSLSPAHFRKVL